LTLLSVAALWLCIPAAGQHARVVIDYTANAMPSRVDSNSPAFWRDGKLHLINSAGVPFITSGTDQILIYLGKPAESEIEGSPHFPMWIEAAWQDEDSTLYAWYHHEPGGVCPGTALTAPEIGALVSTDGGASFTDLGVVLSSGDPLNCSTRNVFFAGGHGDFSVILDQERRYFYFVFDNYGGAASTQGVAMARMAFRDRAKPVGAVWKHYRNFWREPGLGGRLSPFLTAKVAWEQEHSDSFWGPSIHWNTYLQTYVALLNHACCSPTWPQEGIYVTFNRDLRNPDGWSAPQRILSADEIGFSPGFYPQVLGLGPEETDTLSGRVARLYVKGFARWKIYFDP